MKKKLLIIGIDGASFDVINPMIKERKLPTIAKLMEEGVSFEIFSSRPSVTCTAWPSLVTGKNPGNHGIIDWHYYRSNYTEHFHNGKDIKGKRFWDYLGDEGIKNAIINVPITYPPYKINGYMISGFPSVGEQVQFTYPKELREELLKENYQIDSVSRDTLSDQQFLDKINNLMETRKKVCLDLMRKKPWDVFFTVFRPEPIQNRFWGKNRGVIEDTYERMDKYIEELMKNYKEKLDVIVISDHGFGRTPEYNFYLNNWLSENN